MTKQIELIAQSGDETCADKGLCGNCEQNSFCSNYGAPATKAAEGSETPQG